MTITMEQVKALREKTGAGVMDAKKALQESDGDEAKAVELLRQKGIATAEKKSARAAADGKVQVFVSDNGKQAGMVEVNCETDFAGKSEPFQQLVDRVVKNVTQGTADTVEQLLAQADVTTPGKTVQDLLTDTIATVKENMSISRFVRYDVSSVGPSAIQSYLHGGGKIGVLIELSAQKADSLQSDSVKQLLKDLSMQVAASGADFVTRAEVPQDVIDNETRVELGKEDLQSKPQEIREKIVVGRVSKIIGQRVLIEQPFVKDPNKTVNDLIQDTAKGLGDTLEVRRFNRFVLGELQEKANALETQEATPEPVLS
jgi:elongation factor Ts